MAKLQRRLVSGLTFPRAIWVCCEKGVNFGGACGAITLYRTFLSNLRLVIKGLPTRFMDALQV